MAAVTSAVVATASVANAAYQGKKGREAASDAARLQSEGAERAAQLTENAQEQLRGDLSPFREAGASAIPLLQELSTAEPVDRVAQLESNPLFQASLNARDRATLGAAATQGRIGTGDFSQQIGENYLLAASPLIQQQIQEEQIRKQDLLNLTNIGQSSAAQTGVSGLNAAISQGGNIQGAADARSAGIVAGQQATANQNAQIINALPTLIGAFNKGGGQNG